MFVDDLQALRNHLRKTKLLHLFELVEDELISLEPLVSGALPFVYGPKQSYTSQVKPDQKSSLFYAAWRSNELDQSKIDNAIINSYRIGLNQLTQTTRAGKLEEINITQRSILRNLEDLRDCGFPGYIDTPSLAIELSKITGADLRTLSYFITNKHTFQSTHDYKWRRLRRKLVAGMHGQAIFNLAYRIDALVRDYNFQSATYISSLLDRFGLKSLTRPAGIRKDLWVCSQLLSATLSPEYPNIYVIDPLVRDRAIDLSEAYRKACAGFQSSCGGQQQAVASKQTGQTANSHNPLIYTRFWDSVST